MGKVLKVILAVLAIGNLIALFVFDYDFITGGNAGTVAPDIEVTSVAEEMSEETTTVENVASELHIELPNEEIYYDGKENLDLAKDVKVVDAEGSVIDTDVFVAIKAGDSAKHKVVEYSVEDGKGNKAVAQCDLKIGDNYHGPTIEVLGDIPKLTEDELNNITRLLLDANLVKCDDGFGKDITSSVTSSIKNNDEMGTAIVTLKVVNMLNDTVAEDISVQVETNGPVIKLTENKVTIDKGSEFNYLQYIEFARDEDGNNLSSRIRVKGKVDTSKEGEYKLEIYTTDYDGVQSKVKTLTVVVK